MRNYVQRLEDVLGEWKYRSTHWQRHYIEMSVSRLKCMDFTSVPPPFAFYVYFSIRPWINVDYNKTTFRGSFRNDEQKMRLCWSD
jgi:hypothetical protein